MIITITLEELMVSIAPKIITELRKYDKIDNVRLCAANEMIEITIDDDLYGDKAYHTNRFCMLIGMVAYKLNNALGDEYIFRQSMML